MKCIWTSQCQESFERVKYALTQLPVLNLPIFGERFEVICDASLLGIEVGQLRLKAASLHMPKEVNIGEQELAAVVHALQTWHYYLEGSECVVITNHNPLTYLKSQ